MSLEEDRTERIVSESHWESNDYLIDKNRILYSDSFRRLSGVTQVAPSGEEYLFHSRLDHSLKVASTGRRIVEQILESYDQDTVDSVGGINPNVVEAAALAHDIGHPPFGHAGEAALDEKITDVGIKDGFEGNAQSFRIIVDLESPYDTFSSSNAQGLNLTRATLNATLKYPWTRKKSGHKHNKWSCYYDNKEEMEFARENYESEKKCLEANIVDLSDDITYAIHDILDFYRAGLIPLGDLLRDTPERELFLEYIRDKDIDYDHARLTLEKVDELAMGTLYSRYRGTEDERRHLQDLRNTLHVRYVRDFLNWEGTKLTEENEATLEIPEEMQDELKLLKEITKYYVHNETSLVGIQRGQKEVISELFDIIYKAATNQERLNIIPQQFRSQIREINQREDERVEYERERVRRVADVISSMTERQAIGLYKRLTGDAPDSITNRMMF